MGGLPMLEQLGFNPDDRAIIINADDFGISHSTNQATMSLFHKGSITSASLMVPCSAANEAADLCSKSNNSIVNVGIHLTLTSSESDSYRPVFQDYPLRSLVIDDGFLPTDPALIEKKANPEEVRIELEAQIVKALSMGIDVTHLDSHAGTVMGVYAGRDFLEMVFDLCENYELPFNLPLRIVEQPFFSKSLIRLFEHRIQSAKRRGILLIDDLITLPYHLDTEESYSDMRDDVIRRIQGCKPGVTQIVAHPAIVTDELKRLPPHFVKRELEYQLFNDPEVKQVLHYEGIHLISWREIRDLQRSMY